ncbi:MAG: hypothetical protein HA490_04125 [Archaeoglobales archaeon]|jgi:hypothetical protein|nr:hypothetical protein [Archaeoglobus sp.]NHW88821.1 hypothetical protein [Archaeoglobales archaeon]
MRRFDWKKFRRKGLKKIISKDEKILEEKVEEIRLETKLKGSIKEVSKEVLTEE